MASSDLNVAPRGNYVADLGRFVFASLKRLVRRPSDSRRAEARRRMSLQWLQLSAAIAIVTFCLMLLVDVPIIRMMPTRGTESLWPLRIVTEFGKAAYLLYAVSELLVALALVYPLLNVQARMLAVGLVTRFQYIFLSLVTGLLMTEAIKAVVGRGRPFVGGEANAFNFTFFARSEAYASFPSGHATAAFALAFAVGAIWPRLRAIMWVYAGIIALTRIVLLAHHPSDVVSGALIGIIAAMAVRHWFAARRLGFVIEQGGTIAPLTGPSPDRLKRVAATAFGP